MPRTVPPVVAPGSMREQRQPTLAAGGDIELRPWVMDDASAVATAFEDPEIRRWHMRRIDHLDAARRWIAGWQRRWEAETDAGWAVVDPTSGQVLGQAALRTITLEFGSGQITYWVLPGMRRRGVAAAAAREVGRWAFDDLGLHRVHVNHSVHNPASCAVARRAGFELEATLRSALLHADGWHDMHLHARVRTEPVM